MGEQYGLYSSSLLEMSRYIGTTYTVKRRAMGKARKHPQREDPPYVSIPRFGGFSWVQRIRERKESHCIISVAIIALDIGFVDRSVLVVPKMSKMIYCVRASQFDVCVGKLSNYYI